MAKGYTQAISAAVLKLLRPLARILLRNGVPYGVFADLAKRAYVDVALNDFDVPGRKQTVSPAIISSASTNLENTTFAILAIDTLRRWFDKRYPDGCQAGSGRYYFKWCACRTRNRLQRQ